MDSDGGRKEQGTAPCPVCGVRLSLRLARGRKSGKPFIMLICSRDGRHFRAFINYGPYVQEVLERLEANKHAEPGEKR